MAEVIWAVRAYEHLNQLGEYIEKDSPFQAKRVVQLIIRETQRLKENIRIGRMIQELHCDDYRELKIFSYRIIYRIVTESQAAIVAIVHSRRILTHEMVD